MTIAESKLATIGSKKAAEPQLVNDEILSSTTKRGVFDQVAQGICPHDSAELLKPYRTKGVGFKVDCSKCGHTWYINKKIHTCGCLTCRGAKRNSKEQTISKRMVNSSAKKDGGPSCTIDRTFTLTFSLSEASC